MRYSISDNYIDPVHYVHYIVGLISVLTGQELASGMSITNYLFILFYLFIYSPDGQYVAVGGSDGIIHIWEAMTGRSHKVKKDVSVHKYV